MSPWLAYLFGGASGIACTFLAQWALSKPPKVPLPANARPCLIRVAGDRTWCESCGAQWDTNDPDFSFCGLNAANPHKTWLSELLARASAEEKAEAGRVLAASRDPASNVRDWVVEDDLVEMVRHRLAPRATEADHDENNIPMVGP